MSESQRCVAAIRKGDVNAIELLLEEGLDPSAEAYTWSLLIHAIRENRLPIVLLLLEAGADWLGKDGYSRNALEVACIKVRNMDIIKAIVAAGAQFAHEAFRAAVEGDLTFLEGMSDADVQNLLKLRDNGGYGIVHYAAVQGHTYFLDALHLTPKDASIESENELHENAVLLVSYCGTTDTIDYLIRTYSLDPDSPRGSKDNTTSLLYAAYAGYIEMLDHLVETYSSDPHAHRDDYGQSALLNAAYTGNIAMFDHLVTKYGFDPKTEKNKGGKSSLLLSIMDGQLSMFLHLIQNYGFDPRLEKDNNNYSPLLLSAWYGHVDFVDYLVFQFGCDVHKDIDVGKRTALLNAIRNNKLHMVKHLVSVHGVDPAKEMDSEGGNVLINAARGGSVEVLDYFVGLSEPAYVGAVTGADTPGSALTIARNIAAESVEAATGTLTPVPPHGNDPESASTAVMAAPARLIEAAIQSAFMATAAVLDMRSSVPAMPVPAPPQFNVRTDRDNDNYSCVLTAIWYGKIPMIDHLVSKYGCELVGDKDKNGHGPLILAALGKQLDMLDHLTRRYGLKLDEERDRAGNTPLLIAAARGNIPMLDHMIMKHGCDPTVDRNNHEISCLIYAAMFQRTAMIDHLIGTHHCSVLTDRTVDDENVLHFVCDDGTVEVLDHLINDHGARELLQSRTLQEGESPFLRAIRFGRRRMVDHLIKHYGVNLANDTDKHGNNALLVAAKYGQKSLVDHLIRKYRCDIAATVNLEGQTAPVVAAKRRQFSTEEYILSYYGCMLSLPGCVNTELFEFWREHTDAEVEESCLRECQQHQQQIDMNIEACMICYEVLDASNTSIGSNNNALVQVQHLPWLQCGTCKHSLHPQCFHTWVKKARKKTLTCILCQQPMDAVPPKSVTSSNSNSNSNSPPLPAPVPAIGAVGGAALAQAAPLPPPAGTGREEA